MGKKTKIKEIQIIDNNNLSVIDRTRESPYEVFEYLDELRQDADVSLKITYIEDDSVSGARLNTTHDKPEETYETITGDLADIYIQYEDLLTKHYEDETIFRLLSEYLSSSIIKSDKNILSAQIAKASNGSASLVVEVIDMDTAIENHQKQGREDQLDFLKIAYRERVSPRSKKTEKLLKKIQTKRFEKVIEDNQLYLGTGSDLEVFIVDAITEKINEEMPYDDSKKWKHKKVAVDVLKEYASNYGGFV